MNKDVEHLVEAYQSISEAGFLTAAADKLRDVGVLSQTDPDYNSRKRLQRDQASADRQAGELENKPFNDFLGRLDNAINAEVESMRTNSGGLYQTGRSEYVQVINELRNVLGKYKKQ